MTNIEISKSELKERDDRPITTSDETLNNLNTLSDDLATWAKLIEGGYRFVALDKIVPELVGVIRGIHLYFAKFENGKPIKKPFIRNEAIPEGFELRSDVKIEVEGQIVGISLSPSSTKFQLSKYTTWLSNQGMRPEWVVTKMQSRQASNDIGTWPVAVFEMVGMVGGPQTSEQPKSERPPEQTNSSNYPNGWE